MDAISSLKGLLDTFQYESCESLVEAVRSHLSYEEGGIKFSIDLLDHIISSYGIFGFKYGDILEFQGPHGSGKRHLLYFIAAITLLPKVYKFNDKKEMLGGLNEGIILLDCSGKWRTDRLEEIMCEKVKKIFQSIQENTWVIHTPKDFNPYTTDIRTFTISDDSLQIYHHHLPLSYTSQVSHRICFLRKAVAQLSSNLELKNLLILSKERDNILQLGLHLAIFQRLSNRDLTLSKRKGFILSIRKSYIEIESIYFLQDSTNVNQLGLNENLIKYAASLSEKYEDLKNKASFETKTTCIESLNKKILELKPIVECFKDYEKSLSIIHELEELKCENENHEIVKLAEEELKKEILLFESLSSRLKKILVPKHVHSDLSCILEIHAGVGGHEAALFAADLLKMYQKYSVSKNWEYKMLSINKNEGSEGVSEAIVQIDGLGAFGRLKNEAGVHRVQRIPSTESKGRTHTSTATIIVLPKIDEKREFDKVDMKEIKVEVMRSRGAGGQHVNKTESAVRMTHIPTGISVSMQDSRSQHQNRAKALMVLKYRIAALKCEEDAEYQRSKRRSQVSSAVRPEKIRTYNFPQNRITDHRCGYSLYDLDNCMNGGNGLDLLFDKLESWEIQIQLESYH
ncbi:hypothetical protein PORY_002175 [Pneumocystis oryctolagi]|uniref:Uncharacterized protein n=1 Tax=Pneumocystis oryctolagi TaxID=42067 RepID=A0ACB7CBP4_9ASCO|nr:hypothetical protein PORY_002175 [Pneumocystis oryctolagi]